MIFKSQMYVKASFWPKLSKVLLLKPLLLLLLLKPDKDERGLKIKLFIQISTELYIHLHKLQRCLASRSYYLSRLQFSNYFITLRHWLLLYYKREKLWVLSKVVVLKICSNMSTKSKGFPIFFQEVFGIKNYFNNNNNNIKHNFLGKSNVSKTADPLLWMELTACIRTM